ncbi:MAG TPA: adenylate/guanylate cyclase domain-containing protein [Mycobacteriales bacterium]|nr:adenylate/guanylate cyclase domain-containing protein [Mycobacteriales bacterium]
MTAAAHGIAGAVVSAERKALMARIELRFGASMGAANIVGAAVVFLFLGLLLPANERQDTANVVALIAYMFFSLLMGCTWGARAFSPIHRWVVEGEPLSTSLRTYVVRHPLRQTVINFTMWMGSEALFLPLNTRFGSRFVSDVASTILLGAITTSGLTYLLAERILRPLNALAFAEGVPTDPYIPGVKSRLLLSWLIGSAVPIIGIILMAFDHGDKPISPAALAFLGVVALLSGAAAMGVAARSVADPVESVTAALADVEAGRLDIAVPVYDGSQIGQLQAGFNAMVEGLRERRRLRDLFGRQVGEDVARHALERGIRLGGDQVHAAVLFVDVIGSTALATTLPPTAVVSALNEFFAVVVDVVDRTGGIVNKFEGDAALCVFGAPVPRADADTCALLAARLLRDRLADINGLSAAIGVSSGDVVAGNVGTRERFEFTVIGDPVNEAARLSELAKTRPERVLVSAAVLDTADPAECAHWESAGETVLRGRAAPTRLVSAR